MRINCTEEIKHIISSKYDDLTTIMALLHSLKRKLSSYSYQYNYLGFNAYMKMVNAIYHHAKLSDEDKKTINNEVKKLHQIVKLLLEKRPHGLSDDNRNYLELKNLIDVLEGMDMAYIYSFIDNNKGSAYDLLTYLLFEEKSFFFIKYAFEKYPYFVNLKGPNGNCLIIDVTNKYLEAIDHYTQNNYLSFTADLFFYDDVLELLLASPKLNYSNQMKKNLLFKVSSFLDKSLSTITNYDVKSKMVFWINELKNKLEFRAITENVETLSYKTGIKVDFNPAIKSEVERFSTDTLISEKKRRFDTKNEYIITIDGDEAEEIDDGLSIKKLENGNFLLGVHIADPLGYLKKGSIIYDEAGLRTTSIYSLLESTCPMFPAAYSKNIMSLTEGYDRFATSYYLEISPDGEIILDNCQFKKTIVNVQRRLTYSSFNGLIRTGADCEQLDHSINAFQEVAACLAKHFVIDDNYRIAAREEQNTSATNATGNSTAEQLVSLASLACNATVANYMANQGLPFVYRGHELSKEYLEKVDAFERRFQTNPTNENYNLLVKILKNTYPQAFYTTDKNIGHKGLGLKHYSHTTSPLRRFADCLNTEALNRFYFRTDYDDATIYQYEEYLTQKSNYINEKKVAIDYFATHYEKIKQKKMEKN